MNRRLRFALGVAKWMVLWPSFFLAGMVFGIVVRELWEALK